uniref:SCP domain-containing protein n=1 Tax=Strongyloides venezuelensis TaxID=75913 RepID=A0A0K0G226_STRVS
MHIYVFFLMVLRCMTFDLAVTYTMMKVGRREMYLYCERMYSTKKQMFEGILKNHPTIKMTKIVLLNLGTHLTHENFQKAAEYIYENPFPAYASRQLASVVIQEFCYHGRVQYYCLERTFQDYKRAKLYALLMEFKLRFTFKKMKSPRLPKEVNILRKVGWFSFSDIIWRKVWKNCYFYSCYAANGFKQFKLRILNEINNYRSLHNSKPVKFHRASTKLAELYLENILNTDAKHLNRRLLQNYESSPYYFAPLLVKKWYDENKYYKYGNKVAITGTEHFTSIVWRAVTHVGIAVREVNQILHMLVVFEPLPNGVKLFSSNVKRRKYTPFV